MIFIYYTEFLEHLPERTFNKYLNLISIDQRNKNQQLIYWKDKHLHLFGKLLLIEGLKQFGLGFEELNYLEYNSNDKPFLKNRDLDFNISHSGNFAICAISDISKIGIDIEIVKPVEISNLRNIFTAREWNDIIHSTNSISRFFTLWTRKESVIKADGRGLLIPLNNIDIINDSVEYDNQIWKLKEIEIHNKYKTCLASNNVNADISINRIDFYQNRILKSIFNQ